MQAGAPADYDNSHDIDPGGAVPTFGTPRRENPLLGANSRRSGSGRLDRCASLSQPASPLGLNLLIRVRRRVVVELRPALGPVGCAPGARAHTFSVVVERLPTETLREPRRRKSSTKASQVSLPLACLYARRLG